MNKSRALFVPLLFALIFTACNPSDDNGGSHVTDEQFAQNFGAEASRDFIGQVVDTDNHAIQNATIKIGSATAQTDANGVFIINDANVHEQFAYITAEKTSFLKGSRSLVPTTGKNNVKIMLVPAATIASIASGESSEVSLDSGTKVVFDGAFEDENGATYSGSVNVSMFHLSPSNDNIASLMPGMLYAQGEDGNEKVLETLGMLNVELHGSAGQKLNIKKDHAAQISVKIDGSQTASAPASIPLWHFDEAVGYWKQDGTATKQGDYYVGNVSHFSWWNCDAYSSTVNLTVTVSDGNGNPIINAGVNLTVVSSFFNSYVQSTDDTGQVSGLIPVGEVLNLNVFDMDGNLIYSNPIGPFTSDAVLPITIISTSSISAKISGKFTTCDDQPVSNGYMMLYYGNKRLLSALDSGNYSFHTIVAANASTFELEGVDFENSETTGRIGYNFTFPETKIEKIAACNSITEFMYYKLNDGPANFFSPPVPIEVTSSPNFQVMTPYAPPGLFAFGGSAPTYLPGNYTSDDFSFELWYSGQAMIYLMDTTPNNVVFHVNKFGGVGDYVDMTFEGTFSNPPQTIRGQIHVKRDN